MRAGEDEGREIGAGRINGRGKAGATRADDDNLFHGVINMPRTCSLSTSGEGGLFSRKTRLMEQFSEARVLRRMTNLAKLDNPEATASNPAHE